MTDRVNKPVQRRLAKIAVDWINEYKEVGLHTDEAQNALDARLADCTPVEVSWVGRFTLSEVEESERRATR